MGGEEAGVELTPTDSDHLRVLLRERCLWSCLLDGLTECLNEVGIPTGGIQEDCQGVVEESGPHLLDRSPQSILGIPFIEGPMVRYVKSLSA
jgi:hypothetical protein